MPSGATSKQVPVTDRSLILGEASGHFWGHFLDHVLVTFWTTFGCHFGADGPGVIFTAGLGVIVTSWRLGLIKPYKAFQGLLIYIVCIIYKAHKGLKAL